MIPAANLRLDRRSTYRWPGKSVAELDARHDAGLKEANLWLTCMLNAAFWANEPNHAADPGQKIHKKYLNIVHEVFGKEVDIQAVKQATYALANLNLVVAQDNIPSSAELGSLGTYALVDPDDKSVYIYALYHGEKSSGGVPIRAVAIARVLIHEASHASASETYDNFTIIRGEEDKVVPVTAEKMTHHNRAIAAKGGIHGTKTITPEQQAAIIQPLLSGYWHDGYLILRERASEVMHRNADSFGYRCHYERLPIRRNMQKLDEAPPPRCMVWTAPEASDPPDVPLDSEACKVC